MVKDLSLAHNLRYDLPASLVVFLVALPLCLGIALASGMPLFSGLLAGIIGGVVIGMISRSPLSVSGPAAGLAVIVLAAVERLPSLEAFLLAVVLTGLLQIAFGLLRAGTIGDFIPSSVIKGMLAAIGLILILKQIPHAVGYDAVYEGDLAFRQTDGRNTISELWYLFGEVLSFGAMIISVLSLVFLFWWDGIHGRKPAWLKPLPGPLVVVIFGILANEVYTAFFPKLAILPGQLVNVPVSGSIAGFVGQFRFPDFGYIGDPAVWQVAVTLAVVASLETLLCIEAVDKLDPFKRVSPTNRELFAQGVGNFFSGMIGGMPVTSVIVRSSANVNSGARTRLSAILHGIWLLLTVLLIPHALNLIPLSALAAILITVGYKLTKPEILVRKYQMGWAHLIPFVVTVLAILFTDLLVGIGIGLASSVLFIIWSNFRTGVFVYRDGDNHLIRLTTNLSFIHKYELKRILASIPAGATVLIDLSKTSFVDLDNSEIISDFVESANYRDIKVQIKKAGGTGFHTPTNNLP
jgi:MFS superfamily sulfate permease-like transporter